MNLTIFSRVFSYRQRDNSTPLENFLTEAFAFCLDNDELFRKDFLKEINVDWSSKLDVTVATQFADEDLGRPDIEIRFDNTAVLIESKVEARERLNQLEDYAKILLKNESCRNKHLVYLTKYLEDKKLSHNQVKLELRRWCDIYKLIDENNKEITQQFKQFLKEKNMGTNQNFTVQDFISLKTIRETNNKMDNLLEHFRKQFENNFHTYKLNKTYDGGYYAYSTMKYLSKEYWISLGFHWYDEVEIPYLELSISLPKKKFDNTELSKTLKKEFIRSKEWFVDFSDKDVINIWVEKQLTDFNKASKDNLPEMKNFIQKHLDTLIDLKKKYPKYFRK